jgi:hypothetical protein
MEKGRMIRSGRIEEIVAQESHFRVIRLAWVGDGDIPALLKNVPDVSNVVADGKEAAFQFTGDDQALARIPAELASRGVSVLSFGEVRQTVEEIYMKLSKNEVM